MTFWDSTPFQDVFDPTVASLAEMLEDWDTAIRSMTKEQGLERIVCMLTRDRETARKTAVRNKETGLLFRPSTDCFEQDDTKCMIEMWEFIWNYTEHYEIYTSNGSWFIEKDSIIRILVLHPGVLDDGTPDWIPTPRTSCWISLRASSNNKAGEISIYRQKFLDYIILIDADGKIISNPDMLVQKARELSRKWGVPILSMPLHGTQAEMDFYLAWTHDEFVIRWAMGEKHNMDLLDPTWRERVLSNARDGVHPVMWPRVEP